MLFGDAETEKIGSFCVTGRYKYRYIKKNPPRFCQKEEDLPLLFHNMLELEGLDVFMLLVFSIFMTTFAIPLTWVYIIKY